VVGISLEGVQEIDASGVAAEVTRRKCFSCQNPPP